MSTAPETNAPDTPATVNTVDAAEVAKFEAMAAEWWDLEGKFKPLHMLNPTRLDYITQQIAAEFGRDLKAEAPFAGLRILDIGCGGGLLAEPMARLGADVVGADAAERNIPVAQIHAQQSGWRLTIASQQPRRWPPLANSSMSSSTWRWSSMLPIRWGI